MLCDINADFNLILKLRKFLNFVIESQNSCLETAMCLIKFLNFAKDYVATRWYRAPELCGSFFSKVSSSLSLISFYFVFLSHFKLLRWPRAWKIIT